MDFQECFPVWSKLTPEERGAYLDWLQDLEYSKMGLPRPDLVICLNMPTELTGQLMRKRESDTNTHADIHEQNPDYLEQCRQAALDVAQRCGWTVVNCAENGRLRTIDDIHEEIYRYVTHCLEV